MKIDNNLPTGFGWRDENGEQYYGERPPESAHLEGKNAILPNGVTNPLDYFNQSIASKTGMDADQRDAYRNTFLELLIRDQDFQRMSPQAQLERLMATGMSRAQAMQLLSSSGVSGGAGSSVVPQMPGNVENAISERINSVANVVHAVSETAQSIGQLFMIGSQIGLNKSTMQLQAQQALYYSQQAQALAIGNRMAQDEYNAMGQAAAAIQVLYNYQKKTGYKTPDNLNDWLDHVSKTPDASLKLWEEKHKSDLGNTFYYAALKSAFENFRKGDFDLAAYRRQTIAQARLSEIGVEGVVADIANVNQNTANAQETWSLIKQNVRSAKASADYQEGVNDALFTPQVNFEGKSAYAASVYGNASMTYCAGLLAAMDYNISADYKYPIMVQDAILEFESWQGMTQEDLQKRREMFVTRRENQELACWVTAQYLSNLQSGRESFPGLSAVMDFFKSYNMLVPMLQSAAGVYNTSVVGASMVTSSVAGSAISAQGAVNAAQQAGTGVQAMKDAAFIKTVVKGFK